MKRVITIIAFQIGVDCLGFPQFHTHEIETMEYKQNYKAHTSNYFKPYSK